MKNLINNRRSFRSRSFTSAFETMEKRQLMSATSVKVIDSGGPDHTTIEANGTVYAISSHASGGGWSQLWSTKGSASSTKLLLDTRAAGSKINSLDGLLSTASGRVYFTANGGTGGGRQVFQLNTSTGGYAQVTSETQAFYTLSQVIGDNVYLYDNTNQKIIKIDSRNRVSKVADTDLVKMYQAKGQLFYSRGDAGLFRADGTKISGVWTVPANDVFISNDYLYFEGTHNNEIGLFRSDGSSTEPTKITDDFAISVNDSAEIGDYVYFAGFYYNTSPNAKGGELYRVRTSTGEISPATDLPNGNGGGAVDGISAVGNNIYFVAGDGEFITSQGTTDRELFRYSTISGTTVKVTDNNDVYPIEIGAGVLSSYYFVAAPTKDDARFGSRALYRTNPTNDEFELVQGLPSYQDSNGVTRQLVDNMLAGSAGLYYHARNTDQPGDYDTYFVATPYSYIDPNTNQLIVEATAGNDAMTVKVVGNELVMNLNGLEERQTLGTFSSMFINMKAGDDRLTTDANVTVNMSVNGDSGNDILTTGSGNDSLLSGSGKNQLYGGAGNDRLRGSNGAEYMNGGDGKDRLYGRGGSDNMRGANGVDFLYGDDAGVTGGNDTLAGDQSADKIYGYAGNDVLIGGTQNDSLFGGDGDDKMLGQDGNDTLDGGLGVDEFYGDAGDDLLLALDNALDLLHGGIGTDTATRDPQEKGIQLIEL